MLKKAFQAHDQSYSPCEMKSDHSNRKDGI